MQTKTSRKEKFKKSVGNVNHHETVKLNSVQAKTENQDKAFRNFINGNNLLLHGLPGTGKTFIALYLALNQVLNFKEQRQVYIVRSAVPTRDIGFLPGNSTEKMKVYESPYYSIAQELMGRGDAYDILKNKKQVVFMPTSFIRGATIDNAVIIIDEAQNMSDMELHSVITRIGENSRLIICGDIRQDDLTNPRYKEVSGLAKTMNILKSMKDISTIEFVEDDIVRSDFLKEYIIARDKYERKLQAKISKAFDGEAPNFLVEQ